MVVENSLNTQKHTSNHDIALVDKGYTRFTFGCVLMFWSNDVLYYF